MAYIANIHKDVETTYSKNNKYAHFIIYKDKKTHDRFIRSSHVAKFQKSLMNHRHVYL